MATQVRILCILFLILLMAVNSNIIKVDESNWLHVSLVISLIASVFYYFLLWLAKILIEGENK